MADKAIYELTEATEVKNEDTFVLEQDGTAKKLSGHTLGDYVYAAAAEKIAEVEQAVADAQAAVGNIRQSEQEIVESITSTIKDGTDKTLTLPGVPADAKVAGNKINLIDDSTGTGIVNFILGYYIDTSGSTVDISDLHSSTSGYGYAVVPCSEGDIFTYVSGTSGNSPRLWAFIDGSESGNRLSVANASASANNTVIIAPAGSAYLVANAINGALLKGNKRVSEKIEDNADNINDLYYETHYRINKKNILNPEVAGFYTINPSTGAKIYDVKRVITGYIECEESTPYTISVNSDQIRAISFLNVSFFDSEKVRLSTSSENPSTARPVKQHTITTPENAAFMKIAVQLHNSNGVNAIFTKTSFIDYEVQCEKGIYATEYVPYYQSAKDIVEANTKGSRNLLWFTANEERVVRGVTITPISKSSIKLNGTATAQFNIAINGAAAGQYLIPAGTYVRQTRAVSGNASSRSFTTLIQYDDNGTYKVWQNKTVKTFSSDTAIGFVVGNGAVFEDYIIEAVIEEGEILHSFVDGNILFVQDAEVRAEIEGSFYNNFKLNGAIGLGSAEQFLNKIAWDYGNSHSWSVDGSRKTVDKIAEYILNRDNFIGRGVLHKDGVKIRDGDGNAVTLRGIALFHIPEMCDEMMTAENINLLKYYGINMIRLPVYVGDKYYSDNRYNYDLFCSGWATNPEEIKKKVMKLIEICTAAGMYVLLDFHVAGWGGPVGTEDVSYYGNYGREFFEYFCPLLSTYDNILYEVANEPYVDNAKRSPDFYTFVSDCCAIIRQYKSDAIIVCGCEHSVNNMINMWRDFDTYNISDVFVSPHYYMDCPQARSFVSDIANIIDNYGIPIFCTEYGITAGDGITVRPGYDDTWIKISDEMERRNIAHAIWKFSCRPSGSSVLEYNEKAKEGYYSYGWNYQDLSHCGRLVFGHYMQFAFADNDENS